MTSFVMAPPYLLLRGAARGLARRSFSGGWRRSVSGGGGGACQALAFELPHVRDDRPPVGRRNGPLVSGHEAEAVRDDVEDLPVRVLQDLLLVERGRGHVASLEQDALAVPARVVARLAVDPKAIVAAIEERVVHSHGDGRDELPVGPPSREEGGVFLQLAD